MAGDDLNEPVADEVRSILDGHVILSREVAARGHYPAIDVLNSISRVMSGVVTREHRLAAANLREVLATYEKNKDLILIGAYQKGSDPRVDHALRMLDRANDFLKQETHVVAPIAETIQALEKLFANP